MQFFSKVKRKIQKLIFTPYTTNVDYLGQKFEFFIGTFEGSQWYGRHKDQSILDITPELEWAREHIQKNEIFMDIGAHQGYFAILYAKWAYHGQVHAFECFSLNYELMKKNILINNIKNIFPLCCAIGEKKGDISVPVNSGGIFDLAKKRNTVDMITVDDYCETHNIKPTFLKIDVEGFELEVLKGAINTLKSKPKVILEVHNFIHTNPEERLRNCINYFRDYTLVALQKKPGEKIETISLDPKNINRLLELHNFHLFFLK